jgi:hypothetical protein
VETETGQRDFWRGVKSAVVVWVLVGLALLPSRLAVAMRVRGGSTAERLSRALAGSALDFAQSATLVALLVGLLVLALGVATRWRARPLGWSVLAAVPPAVLLYLVTVTEQEVKAERGAFPTVREMLDAAAESSFVEGAPGFLRYQRIFVPALLCGGAFLGVLLLWLWRRRRDPVVEAPRWWAVGFAAALAAGVAGGAAATRVQAAVSPRLSPAGLGAPLDGVVESAFDALAGRAPPRAAELLATLAPSESELKTGAQRLGWPPRPLPHCAVPDGPTQGSDGGRSTEGTGPPPPGGADSTRPLAPRGVAGASREGTEASSSGAEAAPGVAACHPYARPLSPALEPPTAATPLLAALERLSRELFADGDRRVAVVQVALESFRGDDLHALTPQAPKSLAPFFNALLTRPHPGVLVSRRTYQGGVRTAQGLAAMTCGLGTLPWNLSLIRDLEVPVRCASDVLRAAGFEGSFFYGSDPDYDRMAPFLRAHGVAQVVSEADFPPAAPRGAWGGVTDFVLFDEASRRLTSALTRGPQLALVMSLSNHSPFTAPADLPPEVARRAASSGAPPDDLRRLTTLSYTDAAVERLLGALDASGASERTLLFLLADHSTGDTYLWGGESDDAKTRLPFVMVVPPAFVARTKDPRATRAALDDVQAQLDALALSQNDVPALLLALLAAHPAVASLPQAERWHTLGGQRTSPWFDAGHPGAALVGVNGVDELYLFDAEGRRVAPYEDVTFLRTRGALTTVTPRLIPAAATLVELGRAAGRARAP